MKNINTNNPSQEEINKLIDKVLNLHYSTPLIPEQEEILKNIEVRYIETESEEFDRKWKLYKDHIKVNYGK